MAARPAGDGRPSEVRLGLSGAPVAPSANRKGRRAAQGGAPGRVEYEFTLQDALAFNEYHFQHSPAGRRARLRHTFLPPAIWMGLALGFELFARTGSGHWFAIALAAVSGIWVLTSPLFLQRQIRRSVLRMYGQPKNRSVLGRHVLTLSPDGLRDESAHTRSEASWDSVARVARTRDHLFIYLNDVSAHVVPARAFRDREEFERFAETATALAASAGNAGG